MPKKIIERLEVKDLKKAFVEYCLQTAGRPLIIKELTPLWNNFWDKLKNKCSVVEKS